MRMQFPHSSCFTALKVSKYGIFAGPNTEKYRPEKTQYLDTFHVVIAKNVCVLTLTN